uniref:Uncharacterized protein LOC104211078 n=1 Tax=Nicotiana sylvestris TaxID=4096 RepID=A0A1U7UQJ4_NICSY|nr:PREDICTED: uncharacterized protein LOC104211078 [Nicotiana sylvestris]
MKKGSGISPRKDARGKNGLGILVDTDLRELVVEVRKMNDGLMVIKLVVGGSTLNVISAYAPQSHLGDIWGYDGVHGVFDFSVRKGGGTLLLDCAKAFDLVIANSCFPKKEEHLVTFRSSLAKTQIDYLLLQKCDRSLCMDCKVIPSENLTTQHKLLVMDLEIVRKRRKRSMYGQLRIIRGVLTSDVGVGGKLLVMGA